MPLRSLRKTYREKILSSSVVLPLATFVVGTFISVYGGLAFRSSESRHMDTLMISMAREYSKRVEVTLLNSKLQLQSLITILGDPPGQIDEELFRDAMSSTIFRRVIFVSRLHAGSGVSRPLVDFAASSWVSGSGISKTSKSLLTSEAVRAKITSMNRRREPSSYTIFEDAGEPVLALIWRLHKSTGRYLFALAPLQSLYTSLPLNISIRASVRDMDTGLRYLIERGPSGALNIVRSVSDQDSKLVGMRRLVREEGPGSLSTMELSWYGRPDTSVEQFALMFFISGMLITILLCLLIRSILQQNLNVSELVYQRTMDLEKVLDEATNANLAKNRFLANMSHELRTPLNLVLGMIDLLEEKVDDLKAREYLGVVRTSGNHLLSLISDLIHLAQRDGKELSIRNMPIQLPLFFEEIAQLIVQDCRQKNLRFDIFIDPDAPMVIKGDPARLRQVVMNLLRNAIKYTPRGGISLMVEKASKTGGVIRESFWPMQITVKDTGIGIPKTKHREIFDRFVQLDQVKSMDQGGMGLGLAIVKDLVTRMGGTITLDSEIGNGSAFTVQLSLEVLESKSWTSALDDSLSRPVRIFSCLSDREWIDFIQKSFVSTKISFVNMPFSEFLDWLKAQSNGNGSSVFYLADETSAVKILNADLLNSQRQWILLGSEESLIRLIAGGITAAQIIDCPPLLVSSLWRSIGAFSKERSRHRVRTPDEEPSRQDSRGLGRKLKVLVADDDASNKTLIAAYFSKYNWQLDFADNGAEALVKFKRSTPDIVIADLRMPIMDGFELTDKIREFEKEQHQRETPIILVTADVLEKTATRANEIGVNYFLTKPVRKAKLVETVLDATETH